MVFFNATPADPTLPPIDDRLVVPGEGYEIMDGEVIPVPPADEPHGTRHSQMAALVHAHVAAGFAVACDMLTRTSLTTDIAPDVSVFPAARNPVTGGRQLEHVAFEIVATQSISYAGRKAARLAGRGVRRVFAIDLERGRLLEWSTALATWRMLDARGQLEDPVFAVPLPSAALLGMASVDDAVAEALIAKRTPVIEALLRDGRVEGKRDAGAEALLTIFSARGIAVAKADRVRIRAERDAGRLRVWIARAAICSTVAEVLGEP